MKDECYCADYVADKRPCAVCQASALASALLRVERCAGTLANAANSSRNGVYVSEDAWQIYNAQLTEARIAARAALKAATGE